MRDVIIQQPLYQTIYWNVRGVVQQEIAESNRNSKYFTALFSQSNSGRLLLYIPFVRQPQSQNVTLDLVFLSPIKHF